MFKYERLPMFSHYYGMLGHNLKHCASHFVVVKNGGEVDYQYGDFLRAMRGRPQTSPTRDAVTSDDCDQSLGDYPNWTTNSVGLQHEVKMAKGMNEGNPTTFDEG